MGQYRKTKEYLEKKYTFAMTRDEVMAECQFDHLECNKYFGAKKRIHISDVARVLARL